MPAPGFLTDETLLDHLQGVLAVAQLDPATPWTGITHYANVAAYGQILQGLLKRGFSQAQADSWDQGPEFQLDLGTYWSLVRGGLTKDFDAKFIDRLDRRKELPTVFVTAGGVALVPATPRIARGSMTQECDIFKLSDRDLWDWQFAAFDNLHQGGVGLWPGVNNINESG